MNSQVKPILVKEILIATVTHIFTAEKMNIIKFSVGLNRTGKLREIKPL